jgi:hypothetical protein
MLAWYAHLVGQPFQADVRLESLTYLVAAQTTALRMIFRTFSSKKCG